MKTFLTLIALLTLSSLQAGIATQSINYQGQLTDLTDVPSNGAHNFAFELYTAVSGGSPVWTSVVSSLVVDRGLFNADLDLTGLSPASALNGTLFLQVTVDGQLMSPRKPVHAAVFALNSDRLQGYEAGNAPNKLPILDGFGRLDPSVVSAPFPLVVSGTGTVPSPFAVNVTNLDSGVTQVGVRAIATGAGVSGTASGANGAGVLGFSAATDNATASGIWGRAVNGVGVRAWSNASNTVALQASNTAGLGIYGFGTFGAQFAATNTGIRVGGGALGGQAVSNINPATGIEVNSTLQGIVVANVGANAGIKSSSTGLAGVHGEGQGSASTGVIGEHSGGGTGQGIYGYSSSAGGTGIKAESKHLNGSGPALLALVSSPNNVAVDAQAPNQAIKAVATGSVGVVYGVKAQAASADGQAVRGDSPGFGAAFGVYGTASNSLSGAGVYGFSGQHGVWGQTSATAATSYGLYGQAPGTAVRGQSQALSGSNPKGVHGSTNSPDGTGVYGEALAGTLGNAFGVQGLAPAQGGVGVSGQGFARGVAGVSSGPNGHGVDGNAGPAGSGDQRAGIYGFGTSAGTEQVYGVYAAVSGSSASAFGLFAKAYLPQSKAAYASNFTAVGSSSGYALGIDGKIKVGTDNAKVYIGPAAAQTRWKVAAGGFIGVGDLVFVTPEVDISNGGTVNNALWVAPLDVDDSGFWVTAAAPVAGMRFHYFIIDK